LTETRCCPYCQRSFHPSPYRLQQRVCSLPECQRHRRADYHRLKIQTDPVYAQVVQDSRSNGGTSTPIIRRPIGAPIRKPPRATVIDNCNSTGSAVSPRL
jgi:hypothetical protein